MFQSHYGEFIALATAFFWTITAISFEFAGKKIGSFTVNLFRLFAAFIFLGIYCYFTKGLFFPTDAGMHQWIWLSLSAVMGFVIGDTCLLQAYVKVGARISMLMMSLAPPITALLGWLIMGEHFTMLNTLGMFLTMLGIALVILQKNGDKKNKKKIKFSYSAIGLLLAFIGAVGQASGLVLSKYGMKDYDAFASTQIRVLVGFIGVAIVFSFLKRWNRVMPALKNNKAMAFIFLGSLFGPFLGVAFSLLSIKYTSTGIAATIMSIVPILIIPPSIIFFKEKVKFIEIIGAIISVIGVAIFFL
ncbi:MAG: EamA family transporter [Bacteroidetes bacterium]|nr:MAG: EamA family transporter [Bacteroidota bacterium]